MWLFSPYFYLCLAAAVVVHHRVPQPRRALSLVVISYGAYGLISLRWLALLMGLTAVGYVAGLRLGGHGRRRATVLVGALALLLGTLASFKYVLAYGRVVSGALPSGAALALVPLGLSYYTFRILGYLLDVYWRKSDAVTDPVMFAAYVGFFPQLPSGPIQRAKEFVSQIRAPRVAIGRGVGLILFGLFQKAVIADRASLWVDPVFSSTGGAPDPVAALVGVYAYAIQLYADFSGISDIAIGMGRLFGIEAPPNFRSPYRAGSLREFWWRWHMSLTSWITDYVFTPLRLALRQWGRAGLVLGILVNMLLVALWHGASAAFLVFGLVHGALLAASALTEKGRDQLFRGHPGAARARRLWRPALTFHLVLATLVLFRAGDLGRAAGVLRAALAGGACLLGGRGAPWSTARGGGLAHALILLGGVMVMAAVHRWPARGRTLLARRPVLAWTLMGAAAVAVFSLQYVRGPFIYWQF